MQLSIDEAEAFLDETAETFPAALFDELNGGVNLLEDTVRIPTSPWGNVHSRRILQRYDGPVYQPLFRFFSALAQLEDWDRETWEAELRTTLSHELTHHMEQRSGLHALDDRDAEELTAWRQEYENGDSADNTCHAL